MADEIEGGAGGAPETGGDTRLAEAESFFERSRERAGEGEAAPAPERPATGVQTREAGDSGRPAAAPAGEPDGDRAHERFRETNQRKREARIFDALSRLAERESRQGGGEAPAPAAPATVAPVANPFDRETDYWNWEEWERKAMREGIVSSLDEKLKPVLSFFERQQQAETERQRWEEQQAGRRQWFDGQAGIAREAHDAYIQTAEGQGYMDRVLWHVGDPGHPGDPSRGIPPRQPQDGALTLGFIAAGFPEQTARQLALAHLHALTDLAQKYNLNPAVAIDRFTRAQIAAAAPFFLGAAGGTAGAGPGGNGNGGAPATPAQKRVRALKETAAAAVAGSVAESSPRGGGDLQSTLRRMASQDNLGPAEMRELAKRFYGSDSQANLAKLSRAMTAMAAELRAAGAE